MCLINSGPPFFSNFPMDTFICRNLMLQNESVDDDIEHFTDIVEDAQKLDSTTTLNKIQNPAVDECGLPTSHEVKDLLPLASGEVCNSGGDNLLRDYTLPAGYNPKHREPSYW